MTGQGATTWYCTQRSRQGCESTEILYRGDFYHFCFNLCLVRHAMSASIVCFECSTSWNKSALTVYFGFCIFLTRWFWLFSMWYLVESGLRLGILFDYIFFNSDTCGQQGWGQSQKQLELINSIPHQFRSGNRNIF